LGLVLCKELVEKNQGHIRVESTVNQGTTVYITLPEEESGLQTSSDDVPKRHA
jgi:signal transduction histidine kinase